MKHWLFANYGWIAAIAIAAVVTLWYFEPEEADWRTYLATVVSLLSSAFLIQKQKLDEAKLFKELFTEFNARYDCLNEHLNEIYKRPPSEQLSQDEVETLFNYFNLCGEECLMYQGGYIHPKAWKSWLAGMRFFYQNARIRNLLDEELKTGSYYGLEL